MCVCVCALLEEMANQFFLQGGVILNSRCVIDISSSIFQSCPIRLGFSKNHFLGGGEGRGSCRVMGMITTNLIYVSIFLGEVSKNCS